MVGWLANDSNLNGVSVHLPFNGLFQRQQRNMNGILEPRRQRIEQSTIFHRPYL